MQSVPGRPLLAAPSRGRPLPAQLGHDGHVVQFYKEDRFLIESVGGFLSAGIRAGEPVLIIATPDHRTAFERHLAAIGHDVARLIAEGRVMVFDAETTLAQFMLDGHPDLRRFRQTVGASVAAGEARAPHGRFRAFGEMVNVLWRSGQPDAALELEELWNQLAREHAFAVLCGYAMDNFPHEHDAARFADVCRAHSRVVPTESYVALVDSDSQSREISQLQQRAQALESEIERRKRVEDELREALRMRDDFLCVAGHELRTPLTVLRLQLTSLLPQGRAHGHEPRTARRLGVVARQTERLARLAERLLDVSQMGDQRELPLHTADVDLAELVRASVAAAADIAAAAGCQVRLITEGNVAGRWDPDRLDQVVHDLLSNAFKFGAGKDVHVQVRALARAAEIIVRDGGIGIPVVDQRRIFERFERHTPAESFGGFGLGLWIARQVVHAHGGDIRVESSPGQGATFTVTLPYSA